MLTWYRYWTRCGSVVGEENEDTSKFKLLMFHGYLPPAVAEILWTRCVNVVGIKNKDTSSCIIYL